MRILSWNLGNRADARSTPSWFVPAIAAEQPDVLVGTQYVRGPQHVELLGQLRAIGLRDSDVTAPQREGGRCILVAAREPLMGGRVQPPLESDPSLQSGFAHVILEKSAMHLFCLAMPNDEMTGSERQDCEWLGDAIEPYVHEPAIVIADLTAASNDVRRRCSDQLEQLTRRGWRLAAPPASAIFQSPSGAAWHVSLAFVSPLLSVSSAEYGTRFRESGAEASSGRTGMPADAMLLVDVRPVPEA